MAAAALVLLLFFCLLGFAGLFLNFLGTFFIVTGAAIYAAMTGFHALRIMDLGILIGIFLAGECLDWILVAAGARRSGGSKSAMWGSVIGGIAGSVLGALFFGIGAVPGLLAGIFIGAFLFQYQAVKDWKLAAKTGIGSGFGYVISWGIKIALALVMINWIAFRILRGG